jgi:ATP-dependent DNA helicase RecG
MEELELIEIINKGEDSCTQFKKNIHNNESLAQELVAFSNTNGGKLIIGVDDGGGISGLTEEDVRRINQMVSNVASQHIRPAINPLTQTKILDGKRILIIYITDGVNKPYQTKDGTFWVKCGSDKRKATSREELQRLFQRSGNVHADEQPVIGTTVNDLNKREFEEFFRKEYGNELEESDIPLIQLLENMNLSDNGELNLACQLLFGKNNKFRIPVFMVKCVCYPGEDIHENTYIDSEDITGILIEVYKNTKAFITRNLNNRQGVHGVNSIGIKEIPDIVLEELITNALIHRDYFVKSPIRIFIFSDRVEIISPGHLPNNLTVDNIIAGNSNIRNPVLTSFATKILPYRGLGNGVRRALKVYPDIEFIDDKELNQFTCLIKRNE